jgi:hypothetical protein
MTSTALWLDAADSSTITLSGSTVSKWNDKSGNGRHASQETASSQPTRTLNGLNGRTVLTFDGGDTLNSTTIPGTTFAIYSVISSGPLTSAEDSWLSTRTGSTQGFELNARPLGPSPGLRNFSASSVQAVLFSVANFVEQQPFLYYGLIDNASGNVAVGVNAVITTDIGRVIDASATALRVGGPTGGSGASNWDGYIAEIIIATSVPNVTERQKIEGYLAHKWGLTANLPANHPYKTNAPAP